jgi:thiol-disulfide isomerase/thioredoxin
VAWRSDKVAANGRHPALMYERVYTSDDGRMVMSKRMVSVLWVMLLVVSLGSHAIRCQAADAPPPEGALLPNIRLSIPEKPEEDQYLGLEGTGTFTIPKIRAEVVILEIFSMYCPFCQKEAPNVKALFQMIDENGDLKEKVKMIAVGAGNSLFEVNTYKNAYAMAFPHFADADFSIHDALGKVRTPYFIVVRINRDGSAAVIYSKLGGIGDPRSFLEPIIRESGLAKRT